MVVKIQMKKIILVLVFGIVSFLNSCFYSSTLNSAKTIPAGRATIGLGVSSGYSIDDAELIPRELSLQSRLGIAKRFDVGLGFTALPPVAPAIAATVNGDVRLQIMDEPYEVSVLLGGYMGGGAALETGSDWSGISAIATISKSRLYGNIGLQVSSLTQTNFGRVTKSYSHDIMVFTNIGREFGQKWIIAPEVGIMNFQNDTYPTLGVGLKYKIGYL